MTTFGTYILTYPNDFHLAAALINSLRHFNPGLPITLIPGNGFDSRNNPFDGIPVMPVPGGFWAKQDHIDRKFWAFQGPYERFLYLDADVVCLRPLAALITRIRSQIAPFVFAQVPIADALWAEAVNDSSHHLHRMCLDRLKEQLGDLERLAEFDPSYCPYERYPFNAGIFASGRGTLEERHFEELHKRETAFYEAKLRKRFTWKSHDLLFADQGRLNYLVSKRSVPILNLYGDGGYLWGGCASARPGGPLGPKANPRFIHWAGCPRPSLSLFCRAPLLRVLASTYAGLPEEYNRLREVPGLRVWRRFYRGAGKEPLPLSRLKWTARDARRIAVYYARRLFGGVMRRVKTVTSSVRD